MRTAISAGKRGRSIAYGGAFLALLWAFSRGVLENLLLSKGSEGDYVMGDSGAALGGLIIILQVVSFCAVPLFAYLLLEGLKEKNSGEICTRTFLWSIALEVPYNIITSGKLFDFESRSPVAAALVCALAYSFCENLKKRGKGRAFIRAVMIAAAFSWMVILGIDEGVPFLMFFASLYVFDNKGERGVFAASIFSALAIAVSPFYILAPISFIPIYSAKRKNNTVTV